MQTNHKFCVHSVAYSPDGTVIASGADDTLVHVTNADATEKCVHQHSSCCAHRGWFLTNVLYNRRSVLKGHTDYVRALQFTSPTTLVSGGWDKALRSWTRASAGAAATE